MERIINDPAFKAGFLDDVYADVSKNYTNSAKKLLRDVAPELKFFNFKKWEISAVYGDFMIHLGCKIRKVKAVKPRIHVSFYADAHKIVNRIVVTNKVEE